MRTRHFKTPDVHVHELAGVDQTLRAGRDDRLRAIFSNTGQPLRLAGAGGCDSEQVGLRNAPEEKMISSPVQGPDGSEGQLILKSEPFRFPDRLEILGKGQ